MGLQFDKRSSKIINHRIATTTADQWGGSLGQEEQDVNHGSEPDGGRGGALQQPGHGKGTLLPLTVHKENNELEMDGHVQR
jgi:hypothetical protein